GRIVGSGKMNHPSLASPAATAACMHPCSMGAPRRLAAALPEPWRIATMAARRAWFTRFANGAARATGRPATFIIAVLVVLGWAVSGPMFGFSDTWQLVINTGTTIITFLMVFLI